MYKKTLLTCVIATFSLAFGARAVVDAPTPPVHLKPDELQWVALPEFGGREAIIYRSPDGKRVAAAFHETGKATFTYPFDEFLIVQSGTATIHVHGGETFTLRKGDVGYLREGATVDFEFSNDFSDLTFLVADHVVRWR